MTNSTSLSCPNCGAPIPGDAPHGLCLACVLASAASSIPTLDSSTPPTPTPSVEEIAAQFSELEVIELIGQGGMGAVYKVRQPQLDRVVALKILSHDLAHDPAFAERFNREARVLARLNHPNIVTIFDFGTQGPYCYLLMEYIDGVNLRQAMASGGFSPAETLELVGDICGALQFAHEEGILHRDIKPENILLDLRGRVKIADFGIAKMIGQADGGDDDYTLTAQGSILGSPRYMAPEQIEHPETVDQRADIYSLGVVFYELLTGELPIGRFAPPSEKSLTDARIDKIVMRTLEKERQLRYQTASEVKTQVEQITSAGVDSTPPSPPSDPSNARTTAKHATTSAVFTGISLLLGVLLVFVPILYLYVRGNSQQGGFERSGVILGGVVFLVLIGIPALVGTILGAMSLREIRESSGRLHGLGRSLFGALSWPVLVTTLLVSGGSGIAFIKIFGPGILWLLAATLISVTVGTLAIVSIWRWAKAIPRGTKSRDLPAGSARTGFVASIAALLVLIPTLAFLIPVGMFTIASVTVEEHPRGTHANQDPSADKHSESPWRLGNPEIDLALKIPPAHAGTIGLVRVSNDGSEEILTLCGYAIAADSRPFLGKVQIGSISESKPDINNPYWMFQLEQDAMTERTNGRSTSTGGSKAGSMGAIRGNWIFDTAKVPGVLEFANSSQSDFIVASPSPDSGDNPDKHLLLRVVVQPRTLPGQPTIHLDAPIVGGGSVDWAAGLQTP